MVHGFRRSHAACADRFRHELYHALRAHRSGTAAPDLAALRRAIRSRPPDGKGVRMASPPHEITDPVSDDAPGAREIGFAVPPRYNASRILFANLANGNAERIAVRSPLGTLTYAALARYAARAGQALLARGLARGERVLLFLNDTPAYPAFLFGAIRAGLVPVLTNTLTPADLIQFYLSDT